jgi:hypothetical protein
MTEPRVELHDELNFTWIRTAGSDRVTAVANLGHLLLELGNHLASAQLNENEWKRAQLMKEESFGPFVGFGEIFNAALAAASAALEEQIRMQLAAFRGPNEGTTTDGL